MRKRPAPKAYRRAKLRPSEGPLARIVAEHSAVATAERLTGKPVVKLVTYHPKED